MTELELHIKQLNIYKMQCKVHVESLQHQLDNQKEEINLIIKRIELNEHALELAKIQLLQCEIKLNNL